MSEKTVSRKKSRETVTSQEAVAPPTHADLHSDNLLHRALVTIYSPTSSLHDLGYAALLKETHQYLESRSKQWSLMERDILNLITSWAQERSEGMGIETRLRRLERVTVGHGLVLKRLQDSISLIEPAEQDEEKRWPAFASEEFGKLVANIMGLEGADEDKSLILYHILEIEALLGKVERKARAADREYEARLAASLRDICKIHEPSELSDRQIKCFASSLQALIEGWGELNREKLKWIRGRLLEVGLTWLPVTRKAQLVIDEAKSSVKSSK